VREARIAPAFGVPGRELTVSAAGGDCDADGRPALRMGVEDEAGPSRLGCGASDEVGDGLGVRLHDRLVEGRERSGRDRIMASVNPDSETATGDPGSDLDVDRERGTADLLEPEAVLFDEVEREPIAARRSWRGHRELELDEGAGRDGMRQRRARAVPDDRVPELVEPVKGSLDSLGSVGAPRCAARVLECDVGDRRSTRSLRCDVPREPAWRKRPGTDRMLPDAVHDEGYSSCVSEPLLVRAARREAVERTPVWFMRQAGRSLPEYRAIRAKHAFFDVAHTPELCAEVTLQPVRRHDVDAAVMFADIMTPVLGMGIDVRLVEGVGPVIDEPVRTLADVDRLRVPDPGEAFAPVLEAVSLVRAALRPDQAVVGFCGGPFTVAGYLVEGKPSREFALTKSLMLREPEAWHALLAKLSDTFAGYVAAKVRAGADVIQLFDSWVGALSPTHYREHVAPYSARVLAAVDVPTIHFGTGTATLLEEMAAAGGDVIGLDWRIPLDLGWSRVPDRALQGNLDPAVLLAPWEVVEREALDILARAGGRPGHIFNLGHGVFPSVDADVLTRLAALVRERSTSLSGAQA
jgi:uroporphyrinogen decarboxylase